jgi:hypothetical protein
MAVSALELTSEFPEFARCSPELLSAKLRDAEAMTATDVSAVSTLRDMRVKYLACELLVMSPAGEFARLDPSKEPDGARSIYERQRLQIDRALYAPMVV